MKYLLVCLSIFLSASAAVPKWPRLPISQLLRNEYQEWLGDKIVGGNEVVPHSLPFQIELQRKGSSGAFSLSCGGSILDASTILNAAHCVDGVNDVTIFRVVAGGHNRSAVDETIVQYRNVIRYSMHENYNSNTFANDISLIHLNTPLTINNNVSPIKLPRPTSEFDPPGGTLLTVSGWGTTSSGGLTSDVLRSVEVAVVTDEVCDRNYFLASILPSMLCAAHPSGNGGADSCQGDSGGPLFEGTGTTAVQHGIVSWGNGCADARWPGVYTQVSYFLDWIGSHRK